MRAEEPTPRRRIRVHVGVAGLFLVLALVCMRNVLPAPSSHLAYPTFFGQPMLDALWIDQQLVISRVVELTQTIATQPWRIGESGLCHPLPRAYTLGEHLFAEGLLATVPWALTRDPILTWNAVVFLMLWSAALAMYALVFHWTHRPVAAFLAGCLFGFQWLRVADPIHPFVHATQWTALALLFAHRLLARPRWREAAGLMASLGMQLLESFYTVVGLAIVGGVYGVTLVVRHFHQLRAMVPKLAAASVMLLVLAGAVFVPYLETRTTWHLLSGRATTLHRPSDFAPGGRAFPGWVAGTLATVAIADRMVRRRNRGPDDPRLPLLAAGGCVAWVSAGAFVVPGTGTTIPAPLGVLRGLVPGVDAVRSGMSIGDALHLVVAALAGFGAARLLDACPRRVRPLATVVLAAAVLAEVFGPAYAAGRRGHPPLATWDARPSPDVLALAARIPEGAVLDLPLVPKARVPVGHYLLLRAFHGHATAACHNSFASPLAADMTALVHRLPDLRAADALYALGFRTLVVHREGLPPLMRLATMQMITQLRRQGRLREIGRAAEHIAYTLESPLPVRTAFDMLGPAPGEGVVPLMGRRSLVPLTVVNRTDDLYRHPDPIAPTSCLVSWRASTGELVATEQVPVLLPLALGPHELAARRVPVAVGVPADNYEITLATAAAPGAILARARVRVGAPASR